MRVGSYRSGWVTITACIMIFGAAALSITIMPNVRGLLGAALALLMGVIAVSDLRHFTIPDLATIPALLLALMHSLAGGPGTSIEPLALALLRALIVALLFLAVREMHWRLRGREGLGLGDVKLAGLAGAWLDWPTIPLTMEVAALAALAAYGVARMTKGQPLRATNRVPFGLFLAPAIWLGWLFETLVFDLV